MKKRAPIEKIYVVIRHDISDELVVIVDKREAKAYARHYQAKLVSFRWSKTDGQYGRGRVRLPGRGNR